MCIKDISRQRRAGDSLKERHLFNSEAGTNYSPPEAWTDVILRLRCFIGIKLIS